MTFVIYRPYNEFTIYLTKGEKPKSTIYPVFIIKFNSVLSSTEMGLLPFKHFNSYIYIDVHVYISTICTKMTAYTKGVNKVIATAK